MFSFGNRFFSRLMVRFCRFGIFSVRYVVFNVRFVRAYLKYAKIKRARTIQSVHTDYG